MTAATLSFRIAALFGSVAMARVILAGMCDGSPVPARVLFEVLSSAALLRFRSYYRLHAATSACPVALGQVALWSIGTFVLMTAVAAEDICRTGADLVAAIGAVIIG